MTEQHLRQSNTQRALTELRAMIFDGELAPGSDHLETELAERLGMSRTPVREATLTLASQGLVELRPRKGIRVQPISVADMREIYEVLTELEALSAEEAASARHSEADLAALHGAIVAMEEAIKAEDREAWASGDDMFHAELVRLGGNSRVAAIVGMLTDQVRRARSATLFIRPLPTKSNEDHRAVYEAIRAGDAATARARHHAHRRAARDMMLSLLERHRLRQL